MSSIGSLISADAKRRTLDLPFDSTDTIVHIRRDLGSVFGVVGDIEEPSANCGTLARQTVR